MKDDAVRLPLPESGEWWDAQARQVTGTICERCHGWMHGRYVVTPDGEDVVVSNCLVCGHEVCHIGGRNRRPIFHASADGRT